MPLVYSFPDAFLGANTRQRESRQGLTLRNFLSLTPMVADPIFSSNQKGPELQQHCHLALGNLRRTQRTADPVRLLDMGTSVHE